jgi:hypothetical protein
MKDLYSFLLEILIPLVLIISCTALLACHIDGEVKSILTMSGAWAFGAAYGKARGSGTGTKSQ